MTEQPPKKYLKASEILDVLHNANRQFPSKGPVGECPIAKTPEDQEYV